MTIPFRSIRFKNVPVQEWGIFLARYISRNDECAFWPHMTRTMASFGKQMAHLDGMERISPGRNMQFVPYFSWSAGRSLDTTVPVARYRNDYEPRSGFDSKVVLHDSLTLDMTVNPDFSQVESDEPQVTINQRFEVFFPEKRPFFQENSDFFATPETLFFSRRVADPEFGARMTGKLGRWSVAGLAMDDRAAGSLLPEEDPAHNERAKIAIARVQRGIGGTSSIGMMYTGRDFDGSFNRVLSLDGMWRLDKRWTLRGQVMRSFDLSREGVRLDGMASRVSLNRADRDFVFQTIYTDRSPDFRTALGFINRVDVRQWEQHLEYLRHPRQGMVVEFGPSFYGRMNWDRQGRLQDWTGDVYAHLTLPRMTQFGAERIEIYELFQKIGFRQHQTKFVAQTKWMKWLGFHTQWSFGTGVNYYPKDDGPYYADWRQGTADLTVRLSHRAQCSNSYIFDSLRTISGRAIYDNHIVRTKLNYQFTPRLSVRGILDYRAIIPNANLVKDEHAKRLSGDVLMTYMLNPGTAMYIGYTDIYENALLDVSAAPGGLRRAGSPTTSVGRQVFVKLSYLFRC